MSFMWGAESPKQKDKTGECVHTRRTPLVAALPWVLAVGLFIAALIWLNAHLSYAPPGDKPRGNTYERAVVTKVIHDTLAPDPDFPQIRIGRQQLEIEVLSGSVAGKKMLVTNFIERLVNKPAQVGTQLVVTSYDGFESGTIVDYNRQTVLYVLAGVFALALVLLGRRKGLKSLVSLVGTLALIIFLFIPLLLLGMHPVFASLIVVALATALTFMLLNGWGVKTLAAGLSTIAATVIAGGVAVAFGSWAHVSTFSTGEAEHLIFIAQNTALRLHDLLFAGIIIASSGAVMDTSMSLASALWELKEQNPVLKARELFRSGMNIGRDVMGTMTNTLVLAFAGSSINTVLVLYVYQMPYLQLINMDLLVVEVITALSGVLAIVTATPVTAWLCAWLLARGDE
jgi:uncharacterized membrane protein